MKMNRKHHTVSAAIGLVLIFCSAGATAAISLLDETVNTVTNTVDDTVNTVEDTVETVESTAATPLPEEDEAKLEVTTTVNTEEASSGTEQTVTVDATVNADEVYQTEQTTTTAPTSTSSSQRNQAAAAAVTVTGEAQAVISELLGRRKVFADTGTLKSDTGSRYKSLHKGEIKSLAGVGGLTGEVMHATTTAGVDQVDSTASVGDLVVDIAGNSTVTVEFVRSQARAVLGGGSSGNTEIGGLTIGGTPVPVSREINQVIPLLDGSFIPLEIGRVIINEHESVPGGIRVNGIHVIVYGVGEIVFASSTAALPQS